MKTSELQGAALDWAVNQIEECCDDPFTPMFSTDWAQGGPIIEREKIALSYDTGRFGWVASFYDGDDVFGGTPLIAAMRCYVASKLGDEVEIPEELI
jgi:hypothetical protein